MFDHVSDRLSDQLPYDGSVGRKREGEFFGDKNVLVENEGLAFEAFDIRFKQSRLSVSFSDKNWAGEPKGWEWMRSLRRSRGLKRLLRFT